MPEEIKEDTKSETKEVNFKDSLGDDFKDFSELDSFESAKDLAKSYISLSKVHSSRTDNIKGDEDWEVFQGKLAKFLRLSENVKDYAVDVKKHKGDIQELGFKYKIHPRQMKGFIEDYTKAVEKANKAVEVENLKEYEIRNSENFKGVANRDELIAKGVNHSKLSVEELKKELGQAFHKPIIQNLLYNYGKALTDQDSDDKGAETTADRAVEDKAGVENMIAFIEDQVNNPNSDFYDDKSPNYAKNRRIVENYSKKLDEYQKKTGQKLDININP